jgi:aconitate hydratase
MNFIASPEIVTAFAISGKLSFNPLTDELTDENGESFRLDPPKEAPEVPSKGFDTGNPAFFAPPENRGNIEISVDPESERIELLKPWEPWDGEDHIDLPVLMKTSGKTTTDHISPAGPWLRYRGHLSKFSGNMFMGAINAFTGETGKGKNVVTGETGQAISRIATSYRDGGLRWVVVGDSNYGEGSSREHAALSPRLLGGAAVIARSFARIHETNLKKQGLLPLTFQDPADFDLIQEDDRISLVDLSKLTENTPVTCVIKHADGSQDTLQLDHTFADSQVAWFKAGSALNLLHEGG